MFLLVNGFVAKCPRDHQDSMSIPLKIMRNILFPFFLFVQTPTFSRDCKISLYRRSYISLSLSLRCLTYHVHLCVIFQGEWCMFCLYMVVRSHIFSKVPTAAHSFLGKPRVKLKRLSASLYEEHHHQSYSLILVQRQHGESTVFMEFKLLHQKAL